MKRTFLGAVLLCLVGIILPAKAAIVDSGTCGANLTWTLTDDGTLTISGSGEMNDYGADAPWSSQHSDDIKTVQIEQGVTSIGGGAFFDCSSLTSVNIPKSVTSIGKQAFYYCTSLTFISIPESVVNIGSYAFSGTALFENESNWNNGGLYVDQCLLAVKSNLNGSYSIVEGTRLIAGGAFSSCRNLTSIIIPDGVTSIGEWTFEGCINLVSVSIPESMTNIGDYAFNGCSFLSSINIPENIKSIGERTFFFCSSLTSIILPKSMTSIGGSAFAYCSGLTQMTVLAIVPPVVNTSAFDKVSRDIPVYVPAESLTAYQNADVWKEFNLQAMASTGLHTPALPENIRVYDGLLHNPQGLSVSLYDMQGCRVYCGTAIVLHMPAGVYVLQCGAASGKVVFK